MGTDRQRNELSTYPGTTVVGHSRPECGYHQPIDVRYAPLKGTGPHKPIPRLGEGRTLCCARAHGVRHRYRKILREYSI
jgi:hypothetical protein